jgi:hypothetical protein
MLISVHIIQFHRTVHLSIRTCVRFVIHFGGMWPSLRSLMEYRESVFPSIHHSDNIDPNNKFITMCYPLFVTQVGYYRLDRLLLDYSMQEHSPKTCRLLRWPIRFTTFYAIESFITVSTPSLQSNIFCVDGINSHRILRSTFILISLLCRDLQSVLFALRFLGFVFIPYVRLRAT